MNWCSENKIVNGIGDGLFAPDDQITREQIVTILYRFAKFRGLDVGDTTDLAKKFTDAARVSDYAKEALSWAVAVGIINGMPDNTIAPQNSATRAEVATIIMRYTKLVPVRKTEHSTTERVLTLSVVSRKSLFGFSSLPRWKCAAVCAIIFRNPI